MRRGKTRTFYNKLGRGSLTSTIYDAETMGAFNVTFTSRAAIRKLSLLILMEINKNIKNFAPSFSLSVLRNFSSRQID